MKIVPQFENNQINKEKNPFQIKVIKKYIAEVLVRLIEWAGLFTVSPLQLNK